MNKWEVNFSNLVKDWIQEKGDLEKGAQSDSCSYLLP